MTIQNASPFSIPNVRRFIAFRVLFNSRFYYPVFTILFLDFGLTVAQFAVLNAAWAATIVLLEVPSGALADVVGRKRLLVFASAVMVVEIGIIAFVPRWNTSIIFMVFLVNRILSGLAEAAASGADEAIAYDALKAAGKESAWGMVLDRMMRFRAVGFIVAMTTGAAVYDPDLMQSVCRMAGMDWMPDQSVTMRFPLYLTFVMAIFTLVTTLGMKDVAPEQEGGETIKSVLPESASETVDKQRQNSGPGTDPEIDLGTGTDQSPPSATGVTLKSAFISTLDAGCWITKAPFVLCVMLVGMVFDGVIRMTITLSSEYYRLILLPESLFGIIGSVLALLGMVIPGFARKVVETRSPGYALALTGGLALTGLWGMTFFWPWFGILPAVITSSAMYFTGFFVSYYLNQAAPSALRATVLSFKGLLFNVSYGVLGIAYALVLKVQRAGLDGVDMAPDTLESRVFVSSFISFPLLFMVAMAIMLFWARRLLKTR